MQENFVPGQRWLSEAEPDLGLGLVEAADRRQVRVHFAASEQQRTYTVAGAPLARVRFADGDAIRDSDGRTYRVCRAIERAGLLVYHCEDEQGQVCIVPEQRLDNRLQLNRPQDKLLARRIDSDVWFNLRYQAWDQAARLWRSPVFGLQGPRVDHIAHQFYIAAEVSSRLSPRVLLADEVGLGKTIEAGLILHRLVLTERAQRVLLVVPEALINQWLVEMLRRFNLAFAVFDQARFEQSDADNPMHDAQWVLCGLSFLTSSPPAARAVLDGAWDLLIVDEAHHLVWDEEGGDLGYQLVEALAEVTPAVLLLTATPEQLGKAAHFGRLRLLDPQRFHDYEVFLDEETAYVPLAGLAASLMQGRPLEGPQQQLLEELLGGSSELTPEQVIDRLIDRHGTGRVLFRNTRHAIQGFPQRQLHSYPLSLPEAYWPHAALAAPEREFDDGWTTFDPRVDWLHGLLQHLAPDKVLVICAAAETVIALRDRLLDRFALHAAVFHEGMEIVARDRAAAFFADLEEGSQVLICSEIGSEGRNFQFAHHLVLFDLPLVPDLLEQRIGRLDRIGQRDTIELHVPYLQGTASEVLLRWYRDGLQSLQGVCPAAGAVSEQLGEALCMALAQPDRAEALIEDATALRQHLNAELEAGRDRLLELHSFRPGHSAELLEQLAHNDAMLPLKEFMIAFWDTFGVEHEPGPGGSLVVRPGSHMLHEHFPGLVGGALTVTFERGEALAHEDRQFLTWEHPMVQGCIEMLCSGSLGTAAISVCHHPDFRTGSALLECLFIVECAAPPGLEVQRFLPSSCLRMLLDATGEDRSAVLAHDELKGLCLVQNRRLAETVIKSQAARIKSLLPLATERAEGQAAGLLQDAQAEAQAQLGAEWQRLSELAQVNPNVSQAEIDQLATRREQIAAHLAAARVRLDALRLIVMR